VFDRAGSFSFSRDALGAEGSMTSRDAYEEAIDQILEGAQGDVRLALRTVLMQNVQLEARVLALSAGRSGRQKHRPQRQDMN
jgi:hypothetical protein